MNTISDSQLAHLNTLSAAVEKITDPRDPRGVRHDFHGMIVIIFLGLLARMSYTIRIH